MEGAGRSRGGAVIGVSKFTLESSISFLVLCSYFIPFLALFSSSVHVVGGSGAQALLALPAAQNWSALWGRVGGRPPGGPSGAGLGQVT